MTADTPTDLLVGIAEELHAAGIGLWGGLTGAISASPTLPAIVLRQLPSEPSFVLALYHYRLAADAKLTDSLIGVNFRVRSGTKNPGPASFVLESVFLKLHALGRFRFGIGTDHELRITDMYWQSEADLGPDTNGRPERSANYYVQLNQPNTQRE
jgi:hypothetical protein